MARISRRPRRRPCATRAGRPGNPKGVVYSHRSTYLHSLASTSSATLGISGYDRILVVVPQFHANAWGVPYAAWLSGADLIMPKQFLQAEPLVRIIESERPTFACAVPTIWNEVLRYAEEHDSDLSSFRSILCGGVGRAALAHGAVPGAFRRADRPGLGHDRDEPARGRRHAAAERAARASSIDYRSKTGRVAFGVEVRIVDGEGNVAPRDGTSVGEFEIRGPWVTGEYYNDPTPDRFRDGWLRTGDVGTVDDRGLHADHRPDQGRHQDRAASGSPRSSSRTPSWRHPAVFEAAVVAVPDARWDERPLACVVLRRGPNGRAPRSSPPSSATRSRAGGCPSAGRS